MILTGKSLIAGEWCAGSQADVFHAYAPIEDDYLPEPFYNATDSMVEEAAQRAGAAFIPFAETSRAERATFLDTIAEEILNLGPQLIEITSKETGLPQARLEGERGRTVNQLKLFAHYLRNGNDNSITEEADLNRTPLPKPATQLTYLAVGPVAVFGASNFPYAFSTAGGDTASALAAGCPVIVKGHPAHPGTSELTAQAIDKAIKRCGLPCGVFSLLQSAQRDLSHRLVTHPIIKAVGFTGSFTVASSLISSMDNREERIPFYGELGSINPQVIFPNKAQQEGETLAQQLVQSLTLGQGQFCTNPGVWFVPASASKLIETAAELVKNTPSGPLLTQNITRSYRSATEALGKMAGVDVLAQAPLSQLHHVGAQLFKTSADVFVTTPELHEEVFGPSGLIVTYEDQQQLTKLINGLEGQLTASLLATEQDLVDANGLITQLKYKIGRLIYNQMPTGVEVCYSMNHGGPFPASTDVRSTSVGTEAMSRFLRPLCTQK